MTEDKKDLTGLLQYSKALEELGQAPAVPEGSVMEEVPIEKIDSFESLEEYATANPPPETSAEEPSPPPSSTEALPPTKDLPETPTDFPTSQPTDDFQVTPSSSDPPPSDFATPDFPVTPTPENSEPTPDFGASSGTFSPSTESQVTPDFSGTDFPPSDVSATPVASDGGTSSSFIDQTAPLPPDDPIPEVVSPPIAPQVAPPPDEQNKPAKATPLEKVKKFAENLSVGKPAVAAAFPFSLLIHGPLLPEEKEKLLDLITRENMGIREIDLEPQFSSGRLLIPRISEYAGILLVQALRGCRAQIKLGPSDTIFSTPDTRSEHDESSHLGEESSSYFSGDLTHPAESIPISTLERLPNLPRFSVVDTITATASLRSNVVEAESSSNYQEILEALQRELKYKAYRRGATAVVQFKVQLNTLSSPTHYRILVMGNAIKPATEPTSQTSPPAPSGDSNTDLPDPNLL